jgi:putative membrane protein
MNVLSTALLTQPGDRWHYDGGGPPWVWGPIALLVWLGLTALVVWLVLRFARPRDRAGTAKATDLLAERYARGEISTEEYRERLGNLKS